MTALAILIALEVAHASLWRYHPAPESTLRAWTLEFATGEADLDERHPDEAHEAIAEVRS